MREIHDDRSDWDPVPYKDPHRDLIGEQHGDVFDSLKNSLSEESQRTVQQKISDEICNDPRNGGWTRGDIFSRKQVQLTSLDGTWSWTKYMRSQSKNNPE